MTREMLKTLVAPNPSAMTLDGTRTFILGAESPLVIDPGPDVAAHLDAIAGALAGAVPTAILLTHSHPDHADAAPALAARTGAPVMLAKGALREPFAASRVAHWLEEGDEIESDAGTVRVFATPGHAPEHVSFFWTGPHAPPGGAVFVGDVFMGGADTTLVSPPEGDLRDYLHTLDRVGALDPGVLYPAHGPPIDDPAQAVSRYRRHRMERVEQVVRALREAGPSRAAGIVDAVYGAALDPRLRRAAEGSLGALLDYLASAGRARALPGGAYELIDIDQTGDR